MLWNQSHAQESGKMLKYWNWSMEMEVWKRKYGSEKKAVYRRLVPYWVTTVPIAMERSRRLFFSLPYFCFHTLVSALQHFPLVACPVNMFLPKSGHETTTKVLDCTLNICWGVGLLQLWCQSWHHTVQICKLAELAKQKQNQEINKTGTLSHGVSEVTILHN